MRYGIYQKKRKSREVILGISTTYRSRRALIFDLKCTSKKDFTAFYLKVND